MGSARIEIDTQADHCPQPALTRAEDGPSGALHVFFGIASTPLLVLPPPGGACAAGLAEPGCAWGDSTAAQRLPSCSWTARPIRPGRYTPWPGPAGPCAAWRSRRPGPA